MNNQTSAIDPVELIPLPYRDGPVGLRSHWEFCGLRFSGLAVNNLFGVLTVWMRCKDHPELGPPPLLAIHGGNPQQREALIRTIADWLHLAARSVVRGGRKLHRPLSDYPVIEVFDSCRNLPATDSQPPLCFMLLNLGGSLHADENKRIRAACDVFPVECPTINVVVDADPIGTLVKAGADGDSLVACSAISPADLTPSWYGVPEELFRSIKWPVYPRTILSMRDLYGTSNDGGVQL
jgi:hypothetical protein